MCDCGEEYERMDYEEEEKKRKKKELMMTLSSRTKI